MPYNRMHGYSVSRSANNDYTSTRYSFDFITDTIVLEYLKDILFVHDANMYVIYGSKFGLDVESYTPEEMVELSSVYKNEIDKFIIDSAVDYIYHVMNKWTGYLTNNKDVVFAVPETAYPSFKKFIKFAEKTAVDYDDDMVDGILESVRHAFVEDAGNPGYKKNLPNMLNI